jgi:hypothetical protein
MIACLYFIDIWKHQYEISGKHAATKCACIIIFIMISRFLLCITENQHTRHSKADNRISVTALRARLFHYDSALSEGVYHAIIILTT